MALTLSPAMCAIILRPSHKKKAFIFRKINLWLAKGNKKYTKLLRISIANPRRILAGFGMVLVAIFVLNRMLPTSFIPEEDQGFFTVELEMPEGTTLERTRAVTDRAIEFLDHHPAVAYVQNVTGSSPRVGTNQGRATLTVILKPWEERKSSGMKVEDVMADARREFYYYPEAKSYVNRPPVIPGLGESGGLEMQLEAKGDASWDNLVSATDTFLYYASQAPELQGVSSAMQSEIPQLYFDVDRDQAKFLGIPLSDIFSTMKAYLGSVYVNDFNMFNRIYRVYIQAEAPYRATRDNLDLFFVRSKDGAMVPLTALGTTQYTTGPGTIKRFNMFTTASINAVAAPGYSTGEAMAAMERIASRNPLIAYEKLEQRLAKRTRLYWLKRFSVAAACIIAIIGLSSLISYIRVGSSAGAPQHITLEANAGIRTHFNLPDGTVVYLNSGSSLSYPMPYDSKERKVCLSGEAYFKVTHNEKQPFIVSAFGDRYNVRVLGTEFNMQAYASEDQISTTLVKGSVNVEVKNKIGKIYKWELKPSEKAVCDIDEGKVLITKVNTIYETAWMEGKLMFKNMPLPQVLKRLSYFYNVKFEIQDPVINSYYFNGTFENKQLSQVLDYLKISSRIDYEIKQAMTDDSQGSQSTMVILRKKKGNE